MFYNLHQHREATCRRQKEAWEETIKTRLKRKESEGKIPIVIWGLEASPSFFDYNNEASEPLKNRIRTLDLLHDNYLYNKSAKDGKNWGVKLIKKWINADYEADTKKGRQKTPSEYSYKSLIDALSEADFNYLSPKSGENKKPAKKPIHLVYDIFPEWHGLPVSQKARGSCYNKSYMCSKVGDLDEHINLIKSIFCSCLYKKTVGEIHFVWLATQQGKDKAEGSDEPPKAVAHKNFFECIRIFDKEIQLYYYPEGFFNKGDPLLIEYKDEETL